MGARSIGQGGSRDPPWKLPILDDKTLNQRD
jgi:hypothetical protein